MPTKSLFNVPKKDWTKEYDFLYGDWASKPTTRNSISSSSKYSVFFDENGNASYKDINKFAKNKIEPPQDARNFCLTAVVIENNDYLKIRDKINQFKAKNLAPLTGCESDPRNICFHTVEIVHGKGIFSFHNPKLSQVLLNALYSLVSEFPFTIFSVFIDKMEMIKRYNNPDEIYHLAAGFIFERLVNSKRFQGDFELVFESRGHDKGLLNDCVYILSNGSEYASVAKLSRIDGIYFNSKYDRLNGCTEIGLEIADLCSYSVYKHCQQKDFYWKEINPHLNYWNGLKLFPKKVKRE